MEREIYTLTTEGNINALRAAPAEKEKHSVLKMVIEKKNINFVGRNRGVEKESLA